MQGIQGWGKLFRHKSWRTRQEMWRGKHVSREAWFVKRKKTETTNHEAHLLPLFISLSFVSSDPVLASAFSIFSSSASPFTRDASRDTEAER